MSRDSTTTVIFPPLPAAVKQASRTERIVSVDGCTLAVNPWNIVRTSSLTPGRELFFAYGSNRVVYVSEADNVYNPLYGSFVGDQGTWSQDVLHRAPKRKPSLLDRSRGAGLAFGPKPRSRPCLWTEAAEPASLLDRSREAVLALKCGVGELAWKITIACVDDTDRGRPLRKTYSASNPGDKTATRKTVPKPCKTGCHRNIKQLSGQARIPGG